MKELQELYLINNTLTGVIPEEIGGLDKLVALYMNRNKLIGPLPRVFKLKSLTALSLNKNALTGMIPGELFTANIKSIDLSDTISKEYGQAYGRQRGVRLLSELGSVAGVGVWRKPGQAKGHQRGVRPLSLPGSIVGVGGVWNKPRQA
ncbi:hypothetical protein SASPL_136626 [Salvia splendens]|uniref:Uncharacterized protein n=1 Tax=Salvia splendens TaxID=180675 RepID=A0A8X8X092_SALSN|nr:hypothetical protein SASPL_136626 [Salvia splendens]